MSPGRCKAAPSEKLFEQQPEGQKLASSKARREEFLTKGVAMERLQQSLEALQLHSLSNSAQAVTVLTGLLTVLLFSVRIFVPTRAARWLRKVPGPPSYPVVGNLIEIFSKGYHECHKEWLSMYGSVYKYVMGDTLLVVSDPDVVQQVGIRMFKTFHDRQMPGFLDENQAGKALVFSKGPYWSGVRNAVLPLFHTAKLQHFGRTMHECAELLVTRLEKAAANKEQLNLLEWAGEMTMDVLGSSAFGVTFNSQVGEKTEGLNLTKAVSGNLASMAELRFSTLLAILCPPLRKPAQWLMSLIPGTGDNVGKKRNVYMMRESKKIIQARRKEADVAETRHDFLSMLTQARDKTTGEPLSDASIQAIVYEFLGAGTDTTANTLSFAVYSLTNNPAAEEKMRREIRAFYEKLEKEGVKDTAFRPTYDELAQFPYVEQVVQETLRLYPTGAVLSRQASEDCQVAGIHLPKGVNVLIPVYAMHHNPEVFPDPEEFRPERFDPAEVAGRHPYAYIPFGLGPRMCLGHRFAMEEAKLALIRLYKTLTFSVVNEKILRPDGKLDLQVGIVLKPRNGMWVVPQVQR
ncbi:Cytochrome P450 [Klebsormidium nitens]|uniref:Cytochrome P450 n=1 Tax=Klebsormidium nitens TaxID=105231 RepID=A0A1Y1IDB6_KLENI|nr:Cytochrome P450 [Klebsormidium nitens]|eukprot:GAQ88955.1 Cytochrome P450 [Klebsormidium nitens]